MYLHHQLTAAAAAKSDDGSGAESADEASTQQRGRSKSKARESKKRSQTPGKAWVCRASSWVTGDRACEMRAASVTACSPLRGDLIKSFKLRVTTPGKHVAFGAVKVYAREFAETRQSTSKLSQ